MNKNFMDFFEFVEEPFDRMPGADFYFTSKQYRDALQALNTFIESDGVFMLLTGGAGTGKSATIHRFIRNLPSSTLFAYIVFPNLSPEELFQSVLENFGIFTKKKMNKAQLAAEFDSFLTEMEGEEKRVVLVIDEAQGLPVETLEELRLFYDNGKKSNLKIILSGQLDLATRLNQEGLAHLKAQISATASLTDLTKEESSEYIVYRVNKAGRKNINISGGALNLVWTLTNGNLRRMNTLMERTLIAAFMDGSHSIKAKHVDSAARSINAIMTKRSSSSGRGVIALVGVALIAVAAFGIYTFVNSRTTPTQVAIAPKVTPVVPVTPPPVIPEPDPEPVPMPEPAPEPDPIVDPTPIMPIVPDPEPVEPLPEPVTVPTYEPMFNSGDIVAATTPINIRALPLGDSERIGGLGRGQKATVQEEIDEWVKIDYSGGEGWVAKQYLEISFGIFSPGDLAEVTTAINIRAKPESDSDRIGGLSRGQRVTVIEETAEWLKIEFMNQEGWVAKQYLDKVN
ncbi:MAG: SH3 domain-containing protein [Deferribacteraceae bacterium]|jgi:general secretion pathway protein A|nr:SH3 domain-containing protein [Deferribacteraceae bacterium]